MVARLPLLRRLLKELDALLRGGFLLRSLRLPLLRDGEVLRLGLVLRDGEVLRLGLVLRDGKVLRLGLVLRDG